MPYDLAQVVQAREEGGGLDRFHLWVRVDNSHYRTEPLSREVQTTLTRLERFEENRKHRLEGSRRLLSLGLTPSSLSLPVDGALFRTPLFVRERDKVLTHFADRGL